MDKVSESWEDIDEDDWESYANKVISSQTSMNSIKEEEEREGEDYQKSGLQFDQPNRIPQEKNSNQQIIMIPETMTFKHPQKISLGERTNMLHWVSQIDGDKFSLILKRLTTPPAFDVKELWTNEKAKSLPQIEEPKTGKRHYGQKQSKKPKKADLIRAKSSIKINQKLNDNDTIIMNHSLSRLTGKLEFNDYRKMIIQLKTPEKIMEMKTHIFKHLLKLAVSPKTIDLKNLIDIYFEMLTIEEPDFDLEQIINQCEKLLLKMKINLVEFQLNLLSDRLPPLVNFSTNSLKLDQWQTELLELIDQDQSAIVCAPTSAGKTVISTYAATQGRKVLFVAPSEPLAAQVGGLFREILGGNVEIVTNNYHMQVTSPTVLVGTPLALETCIIDGHFVPEYAVFDEIHELNGDEGASFERLIKLLNCHCLCLSATIKNLDQIKAWLEKLHNESVHVVIQDRRFINLQKHIWLGDKKLHQLHPLSTIIYDDLLKPEITNNQFSFTPADCYNLWLSIEKFYPKKVSNEVSPTQSFERDQRLTLHDCFLYEKKMIKFLHKTATSHPECARNVLSELKCDYTIQKTTTEDLYDLSMALKNKKMTPSILFQLNSSNCEEIYQKMVAHAENEQDKYVPYHREFLELQQKLADSHTAQIEKFSKDSSIDEQTARQRIDDLLKKNVEQAVSTLDDFLLRKKDKIENSSQYDEKTKQVILNYIAADREENLQKCGLSGVDIYQPHRDFCYTEEYLSDHSVAEIKWDIQGELKLRLQWDGWFLRGISRGIGLYMDNMPSAYQRAVQSLAQNRKLAIVISDKSLAYGVNLPIKTCCLIGYNQDIKFNPLVAQQMFGRAGRRGLDNEGNIVFVNVNMDEIMKGELSQIVGNHPETPAIATFHQISPFVNHKRMERLLSTDLGQFIQTNSFNIEYANYNQSNKFITDNSLNDNLGVVFWSLRNYGKDAQVFMKHLNQIKQGLSKINDKQFNKAIVLFRILVNIFHEHKLLIDKNYSFDELIGNQTNKNQPISAFTEFRIPDEYDIGDKHKLKNSIIYMGNVSKIIHNYLFPNQKYEELVTLIKLVFLRIKDLIDKYTF